MAETDGGLTLEDVLNLVKQLSPLDKVRLIEHVMPESERVLLASGPMPGLSLDGLVKDLGPAPSAEEIDAARREAWASFPGEDIGEDDGERTCPYLF